MFTGIDGVRNSRFAADRRQGSPLMSKVVSPMMSTVASNCCYTQEQNWKE